jgi:SAM-dependent methyltransferase
MKARAGLQPGQLSSYEDIADEYYDAARHPTCASLRELSAQYLAPRIARCCDRKQFLVEVGAGQSMLAPIWAELGGDLRSVELIDSSPAMLSYSAQWEELGVRLRIADAVSTGLESESVDVLIASLGDPYNTFGFWKEVARVLHPGGVCHFTTPASEWAFAFRDKENRSVAEFLRADGTILQMPSPVLTHEEQMDLLQKAGLSVLDEQSLTLCDLASAPASKLLCVGHDKAVVRGYSVRRRHVASAE